MDDNISLFDIINFRSFDFSSVGVFDFSLISADDGISKDSILLCVYNEVFFFDYFFLISFNNLILLSNDTISDIIFDFFIFSSVDDIS